ncbi:disheveled-associated activator of morphogenesis 2 isoform X2 [Brachionus plicatilis]|uniref:Disheveled-associated activator of morphogenesis 2 isoform X2 n=1 Tax=Brachionus plicatilis TaxID=10195 RepID=A0A3M7QRM9_BRAPC|nr:disheveled-associated activator of morphogenesis 2 isoform X2 [Brachionus plicatilis]
MLLCIVNYVNQNNQNGNAFGFKLNFLNKLGEIKTNERGLSLLHCLIMMIKDNHPELMKLPEELESVKNMAVFNITDLSNEILNLESKMKKINELMNKMKTDRLNFEKNRKFFEFMAKFYEDNKKRIESTRNDYNEALKKYDEVSKYFGESGSLSNFNDFFLMWSSFIKTFSNVRDDLEKKSIKESKNKFTTVSNKDSRRTSITKRINQRNDSELNLVLNNLGNDSDFNRFCSEIQSGEIFTRNKTIRRDVRNRTKSYNLSKGANSRSRSPSVV